LDFLVDTALEAGALGASLTGAGIAGSVLALCRAGTEDAIAAAVRARMVSPEYGQAGRAGRLTQEELARAVCVNTSVAPAGEIALA
jgi:galactokinase